MRILTVAVVTIGGVLVSQVWTPAYLGAIAICLGAFVALLVVALQNPAIASLRHASLGAGALLVVAVIVGSLLIFGTDLPLEVRVQLRIVILAAATAPALYWLLWVLGGFKDGTAGPAEPNAYRGEGDH